MRKEEAECSWLPPSRCVPDGPGVYVMRDARGKALYVGKAKSLRARLQSYRDGARLGPKARLLLSRVSDLETIITDSELEALILENSLIKEHRPRYNITLRDDKTYPFLRLSVHEEFPVLSVVRRPVDDGAKYFGPFVPAGAMRRTLKILQRIFPLRRCAGPLGEKKKRGCLNLQMRRCLGPCTGGVGTEEYGELVDGVRLFLAGAGVRLVAQYRRKMEEHAARREYEQAAVLRDRIAAIESTLTRQKAHFPGKGDRDIVGLATAGTRGAVTLLAVRKGRITEARTMSLVMEMEEEEALAEFLRAYYDKAEYVPPVVLLPRRPAGAETLASWLGTKRGRKVALAVPRAGPARSLVRLAVRNALESLQKRGVDWHGALAELEGEASGGGGLRSLAAMDMSNLRGTFATGALVWWEEGRFVRRNYRRFRIREAGLGDDYGAMKEAAARLGRRVVKGEWPEPDVLLLDGGGGHLAEVRRTLAASGWEPRLILAMAKGGRPSKGDTVLSGRGGGILRLGEGSLALRTLQAARDEAHRAAVTYHRSLRASGARKSALDEVQGIGPARKRLLLRRFGSLKRLGEARREELLAVDGLPVPVAENLYAYLRKAKRREE